MTFRAETTHMAFNLISADLEDGEERNCLASREGSVRCRWISTPVTLPPAHVNNDVDEDPGRRRMGMDTSLRSCQERERTRMWSEMAYNASASTRCWRCSASASSLYAPASPALMIQRPQDLETDWEKRGRNDSVRWRCPCRRQGWVTSSPAGTALVVSSRIAARSRSHRSSRFIAQLFFIRMVGVEDFFRAIDGWKRPRSVRFWKRHGVMERQF
jgi:hypothetical protein